MQRVWKCLLTYFLCILIPAGSQAQTIYFSPEEKVGYSLSKFEVLGYIGDRLYTFWENGKAYHLNAYNDSMHLKAKIALDFFPGKTLAKDFVTYADGILVFYQAEERNQLIQYVARLDENALLIGRPKAIDSVRTRWFGGAASQFKLLVSEDKSKLMVYGEGKDGLRLTLLDAGMHVLSRREVALKAYDKLLLNQAILDNAGRLHLILVDPTGNKDYARTVTLASITPQEDTLTFSDYTLPDQYLSGTYSTMNNANGLLYSVAFYSQQKNGHIEGLAYFTFDPSTRRFEPGKLIPFSEDVIMGRGEKSGKKAFNNYKVRELLLKGDDGFLLVAEDAYSRTRAATRGLYYSHMHDRMETEYYYSDILTIDIGPSGNVLWHKFIRKDQYSVDDGAFFSSYAFMNTGGSLAFLFNTSGLNPGALTLAVLDKHGELQIIPGFAGNEGIGDWIPRLAEQTDTMQWVIPVLRQDKLYFAKLRFEE